jgi:hypothetical protein
MGTGPTEPDQSVAPAAPAEPVEPAEPTGTGGASGAGGATEGRGAVEGRVLDGAGAPVAGATVAVAAASRPTRDIAALTRADGGFRLGGLLPGTYRLEARSGTRAGESEVEVAGGGATPVEIRIGDNAEGTT